MATSIKPTSIAIPPEALGGDDLYAQQYAKSMEAEQKLMDLLEQKRNQSLSPSWLTFAGEMLDPGRTGSFGEALGRAARGYAAGQQIEQKQALEDAAMMMQLQQMKLDRAMRAQGAKALQSLGGEHVDLTEGETPPGASGPALRVQGKMVTPDDISNIMYANPELGKALEIGYRLKLETLKAQPGWVFDAASGKFIPAPGQEPKPEPVPEISGTLLMPPSDAQKLRDARSRGDAKAVYQIIDMYQKGIGPRPAPVVKPPVVEAPAVEAPVVEAPAADMTIEGRQVKTAKEKAAAEKFAGMQAESTAKFLEQANEQRLAHAAAADTINILAKNPKIVGYLNKPGVGNAIWGFIQDTLRVRAGSGQTGMDINVSGADVQTALMKVDPNLKLTEKDLTDLGILTSNLARLELGLRRTRPPGEGSLSNIEGQPYKDIVGNRYDTSAALMRKMKLAARQFEYDMDVADAFRKFDEKAGGNKTLEDFRRSKEYTRLSNDYDKWLNEKMGIPFRKSQSGGRPSLSLPDQEVIDEAKRRGLIK